MKRKESNHEDTDDHHFRVLTDAAPLKLDNDGNVSANVSQDFRVLTDAAPLKLLAGLVRSGAANPHFRVLTDAAPLKRPWY